MTATPWLLSTTIRAVSYTHLDVYKRQVEYGDKDEVQTNVEDGGYGKRLQRHAGDADGAEDRGLGREILSLFNSDPNIVSVSYTHLDVYKRQPQVIVNVAGTQDSADDIAANLYGTCLLYTSRCV